MIDHRLGQRHRVRIPVRLHLHNNLQATGQLLDISLDGMFVATAALPGGNGHVVIQVAAAHASGCGPAFFPAQVVHYSEDGFGVMLGTLNTDAQSLLERWLLRPPDAASPAAQEKQYGNARHLPFV